MRIGFFVALGALLATVGSLGASPVGSADPSGDTARFSVASQTQVPGETLPAGTYSIRVVDHLSDRMIVQVDRPGGKHDTFLALPKSALTEATGNGPILLKSASTGETAMRGFKFADGTVAEFVFPKAEAVSIAKANGTTIPAIDPASEGRTPVQGKLSKSDLQMVTLWMLTPQPVGPESSGPGVSAKRYQEQASADVPNPPKPRARPVVKELPHTASAMPLEWLLGIFSVAGAAELMRRRLQGTC